MESMLISVRVIKVSRVLRFESVNASLALSFRFGGDIPDYYGIRAVCLIENRTSV